MSEEMLKEIREEINEKSSNWLNTDNWAVYITPSNHYSLVSQADVGFSRQNLIDDTIDDVQVIIDREVDGPTILPQRADMMPSDLHLQENPPIYLVKQMVDPVKEEDPATREPRMYTLKDKFSFEVRSIEYVVFIDQLSADLRCPTLDTMLGKAVGGESDWGFDKRSSSWVFRKQFDVGEEVREIPFTRRGTSQDFIALDVENEFAHDAIETIGGEVASPIFGEREIQVEQETDEIQMTAEESDPCSFSYETETERVKLGEKRYNLDRLYVH